MRSSFQSRKGMAMNELDFEDLVLANLDEAERLTGHNFKGVRELIEKHGAVEAAKMLIDINMVLKEYSGFKILDAHDLDDSLSNRRLSTSQNLVCSQQRRFRRQGLAFGLSPTAKSGRHRDDRRQKSNQAKKKEEARQEGRSGKIRGNSRNSK